MHCDLLIQILAFSKTKTRKSIDPEGFLKAQVFVNSSFCTKNLLQNMGTVDTVRE